MVDSQTQLLDWIHLQAMANIHLVGGFNPTPPKNHGVKVSWDDDIPFPINMESHNPFHGSSHHQPDNKYHTLLLSYTFIFIGYTFGIIFPNISIYGKIKNVPDHQPVTKDVASPQHRLQTSHIPRRKRRKSSKLKPSNNHWKNHWKP